MKKWLVSYSYHNHCTGQTLDAPVMTYIYNDTIAPAVVLNHEIKGQSSDCASDVMIKARLSDMTNCGGNQRLSSEALLDVNGDNTIDYISSYRLHYLVLPNSWTRIKIGHVDYSRLQSLFPNINFAEEINVSYMQPIKGKDSLIWLHPLTLENTGLINRLLWKVTDDCGNNSSQIYEFRVLDQKPPSSVCIELSTSLTSGDFPSVELWARDFVKDVSDNCTPETEILLTFDALAPTPSMRHIVHYYKKGHDGNTVIASKAEYESGDAQKWLPEKNTSGKVWLKSGILNVPVYVWDQQGNVNHCTVKLAIINTDEIAPISGRVFTINQRPKKETEIILSSDMPEFLKSAITDDTGHYQFESPLYTSYKLSGEYNGDYMEGVSTLDLVLIQRHILGLEPLDNIYKMIASDVNNDGKITAADLVALRKLILGMTNSFANKSWRIPVKNQSHDMSRPFAYLEHFVTGSHMGPKDQVDFVAVKIGDINGNASGSNLKTVEPRSNKKLNFVADNLVLIPGESVSVPIYASNYKNMLGFQTTLKLKDATFVDLIPDAMEITDAEIGKIGDDMYTISFASEEPQSYDNNKKLFTLVIEPKKPAILDEVLSFGSSVTQAESYDADLKVGGVNISFRNANNAITLFQNEPNPFLNGTTISWVNPKAENTDFILTDEQGKVILSRNIKSVKGLNTISLDSKDVPYTGVYYYSISNSQMKETKKMVKIE